MIRIAKNSSPIPMVLQNALGKLHEAKASTPLQEKKISAPRVASVKTEINRIPLRIAQKRKDMKSHGSGVYSEHGDIWYREGEFLVKKDIDINKIVDDYIANQH